jgi:hypothetical protein
VELDAVTDKYVVEAKKSYKAVKIDQFKDFIIPAAAHCFPKHQVVCVVPPAEVAQLQKRKLGVWELPVTALKL